MACGLSLFSDFFTFFNDEAFSTILDASLAIDNVPTVYGISFGECTTVCGSLGIAQVNYLGQLEPATDQATVEFSTCGLLDSAILRFPISSDINFHLVLRASGKSSFWPANAGDQLFNDANATLSGEIVFEIPIVKKSLMFSQMHASVSFLSTWTEETKAAWPDNTNALFERVPLDLLLSEWNKTLNSSLASNLEKNIAKYCLVPDLTIDCTLPTMVPMLCTKEMALDPMAQGPKYCHPCDTCCKCFIQQRCDSGCEDCACMNCTKSSWKYGMLGITILIFFASFFLLRKCIYTSIHN